MTSKADTIGQSVPAWPKDALRVSFGIIWLIDAIVMGTAGTGWKGAQ